MKIIIGGALGHMGRELAAAAQEAGDTVVCGVDIAGGTSAFPVVKDYAQIAVEADALIDFSRPAGLPALLKYAEAARMPLVLCTTGYTDEEQRSITEAAETLAILQSVNMSLGIAVMRRLVAMATRALGDGYDVEIVEKHHRRKADSPSGTALILYEAVSGERDQAQPMYGRHGRDTRRKPEEIGIHAVRGGTVAGEHEVGFYGNAEELIITHRAENRALFAQGALRAARFLRDKPAGRYTMEDVVSEMIGR
jgi:4-hydroxy-tetrahydrodipicolinate reductase